MCAHMNSPTAGSTTVCATGPTRLPRTRRPVRTGATAVEFAMVAPIFFLLIFICFEFTRLCMMNNLAQDAAYMAARYAMVEGSTADDASKQAKAVLNQLGTKNATITINGGKALDDKSASVTVKVDIPMKDNSFVFPRFTGNTKISAEVTLTAERYNGFYSATAP